MARRGARRQFHRFGAPRQSNRRAALAARRAGRARNMSRMILLLPALCLAFAATWLPRSAGHAGDAPPAPPAAQSEATLESRAAEVQRMISASPEWADGLFDAAFLQAVPPAQVAQISKSLHSNYGAITEMRIDARESPWSGKLSALTDKGFTIPVSLTLDASPPHAVVGLWFGQPVPRIEDWAALVKRLRALHGDVSFGAWKLGETLEPLAELESDRPLALGSAFKLYVLGALARELESGALRADSTVELRAAWRSLPSGRLQDWPAGLPMTVSSLAAAMISESDNTATDHLLFALGRAKVEAMLPAMGNEHAARSLPFLGTAEMFRLKLAGDGALADAYAGLDESARRAFLAERVTPEAVPLSALESAAGGWTKPRHVDDVEWFGSARDMARAMDWLRLATAGEHAALLRGVLAINPGITVDRGVFPYAGFKGGSEPGVVQMCFLLQHSSGDWYALCAGWNDTRRLVDETEFAGLVARAIELVRP
jgi:beta-lactamase class A